MKFWLFENWAYQNPQNPVDDGLSPICSHDPIQNLKSMSNQSQTNRHVPTQPLHLRMPAGFLQRAVGE